MRVKAQSVKDFYKERGFGLIKEDGVGNTEWLLEVVDYKPLDTKIRKEKEIENPCHINNKVIAANKDKVNDVRLSIGGDFSKATASINFGNTLAYTLRTDELLFDKTSKDK